LRCANGTLYNFEGYGECHIYINNYHIILERVLCSPYAITNIISSIKLINNGIKTVTELIYNKVTLKLINNSKTLATFTANNLDQIIINLKHDNNKNIEQINALTKLDEESKLIWNRRLGHFYHNNLEKYLKIHKITEPLCIDCKVSKMKKKPHNQEIPRATQILEVIHSDIIGPLNESINGYRFIIIFIDEKSRKGWVYNMRHKSEAIDIIIYTLKFFNNLFEKFKIKKLKSDQGREYQNSKIINFCKENGIYKEYSPPYNPKNNGLAERFNQTIISYAKTLIYWSKISSNFWDYAIIYSNYLYNNTPYSQNNFEIPNEIFYDKLVAIKHVRTFGCITYYKNINNNKLEPHARKDIFLGFKESSHSYCKDIINIFNTLHNLISYIKLFNVNHIIKSYVNT